MKKTTIALIIAASVVLTFSGCMASSHTGYSGSNMPQHSVGCH